MIFRIIAEEIEVPAKITFIDRQFDHNRAKLRPWQAEDGREYSDGVTIFTRSKPRKKIVYRRETVRELLARWRETVAGWWREI